MSDDQPEAEPQAERWLYAGIRVDSKGAKVYRWLTADGKTKQFRKGTVSHAIGAAYTVQVAYAEDGKGCTMYGDPQFAEKPDRDDPRVAQWEAADRIARTKLARKSAERNAAKESALLDAIGPLEAIAAKFSDTTDLDALSAFVLRRINNAYWTARMDRLKR